VKSQIETDGFLGFKSKSSSQFESKTLKPETGTESNSPLIRRYSVKELEECYPDELFERERKCFWNQKAEVENDIALRHWGVQALNGVVDVAWTLKKTELLQLHVQKCETVYTEIMKDNSVLSRSMMGNLDQVERAHAAFNGKYNDLCRQMDAGKITQANLDQGLDEKFSVLKKTQANLVKSYQAFISKCAR
jgi:gamma-glutamylcysteine synthetase